MGQIEAKRGTLAINFDLFKELAKHPKEFSHIDHKSVPLMALLLEEMHIGEKEFDTILGSITYERKRTGLLVLMNREVDKSGLAANLIGACDNKEDSSKILLKHARASDSRIQVMPGATSIYATLYRQATTKGAVKILGEELGLVVAELKKLFRENNPEAQDFREENDKLINIAMARHMPNEYLMELQQTGTSMPLPLRYIPVMRNARVVDVLIDAYVPKLPKSRKLELEQITPDWLRKGSHVADLNVNDEMSRMVYFLREIGVYGDPMRAFADFIPETANANDPIYTEQLKALAHLRNLRRIITGC